MSPLPGCLWLLDFRTSSAKELYSGAYDCFVMTIVLSMSVLVFPGKKNVSELVN